jgi:hypothetical protein
MDYSTLSNVCYYLMFNDVKDEKIWEKFIKATIDQPHELPMTYYKSFKYSKYYLNHHLPDVITQKYKDRFWYAERYFD